MSKNNIFKQLQTTFSIKLLCRLLSNFTWSMIRLQGFRIINLGQAKNPRWPPLLEIAKTSKSTSSPEPLDIIGYKLAWNIDGTLVFKIIKIKKSTAELDHSDLLSVCKSIFALMPISQENMHVFLFQFDHNGPWMEQLYIYANWLSKIAARGHSKKNT